MSDSPITILASEYKAMADRIAALESDERRRIAGQILAARYAIAKAEYGESGVVYMTGKQALEMAGAVIRKLEDAK